jgi:O-antigen/teichoic acid export membrane protein
MENIGKKVKHGIKWQFVTNIFGQAIYLINGVVLARILGPKDFGIYGMSLVLSNFIFMFWNLGLNAALIQRKELEKKDLDTAFSLSIIMGLTCFIIVWFLAPFLAVFFKEPLACTIARIIGITFIFYALDRIPTALLMRNLRFKENTLVGLANPIIYGLVAIPLALSGFGPLSFAWGVVLGTFAVVLGRIILGLKLFQWRPKPVINRESTKHLFGFGVYIMLSDVLNYCFWNLQRIIAGRYFGATDLGYLTRSSNLSVMPLHKVHANVGTVLLPGFSGIQDNKEKIKNWFRKFTFFTYSIIAPPLLFMIFFPKILIVGVFGAKWAPSSPLLMWLALAVLISASTMYINNILQAIGKPKLSFYVSFIRLIPFTILLLLSVKWGIKGIAMVLFVDSIIAILCYVIAAQTHKTISFMDIIISSWEPILVSFVSCALVYILKPLITNMPLNPEMQLLAIAILFGTILLPYYLLRYFKKSFIVYLGFDIRKVAAITSN